MSILFMQTSISVKIHSRFAVLICLATLTFSNQDPESVRCRPEDLLAGVKVTGPCTFFPLDVCAVKCTQGRSETAIWQMRVQCLKSGQWSHTPSCEGVSVEKSLQKVECDKYPVTGKPIICFKVITKVIRGNATNSGRPKCPPLVNMSLDTSNCSREPDSACQVQCGEGRSSTMRCLPDGRWSHVPECLTFKPKICPEPEVGRTSENCSRSEGEWCQLTCPDGKNTRILCVRGRNWYPHPACTCPDPSPLRDDVVIQGNCSSKGPGEACRVSCTENSSIPSHHYIVCQKDITWTARPSCSKGLCMEPELPPFLTIAKDRACNGTVGSVCEVACKGSRRVVGGQNVLTCQETLRWSPLPLCTCAKPALRPDVTFLTDSCDSVSPGDRCYLKCDGQIDISIKNSYIVCGNDSVWSGGQPDCGKTKTCPPPSLLHTRTLKIGEDGGSNCSWKKPGDTCKLVCVSKGSEIIGTGTITCLSSLGWSDFPTCACPPPKLNTDIKTAEEGYCSGLKAGEQCRLTCKNSSESISFSTITCKNDSTWTAQPKCNKNFCDRPRINKPYVIPEEACSYKLPGETCKVSCGGGGQITGNPVIRCVSKSKWSSEPECGCSNPILPNDVETINGCSRRAIGSRCNVKCKDTRKVISHSNIVCSQNLTWNAKPQCRVRFCLEPSIPPSLKNVTSCSSKTSGQRCELTCTRGSLVGDKNIVCLMSNWSWSAFPTCSCPPLDPKTGLVGKNCTEVKPGERCSVSCRDNFSKPDVDFISCDKDGKWGVLPECKKMKCRYKSFTSSSTYRGECTDKLAGDVCQIRCIGRGEFLQNDSYIRCNIDGTWTHPRECVCPPPRHSSTYILKDTCLFRRATEQCPVSCANRFDEGKPQRYIKCDSTYHWTDYPPCQTDSCPAVILSSQMTVVSGNCNQMKALESCKLACKKGTMLGSEQVFCDKDRRLSQTPRCVCPRPSYGPGVRSDEVCEGKAAGETCSWFCESYPVNIGYIQCTEDLTWFGFRDCPCTLPNLHENVHFMANCKQLKVFTLGTQCDVACSEPAVMINGPLIQCKQKNQWEPIVYCVCPPVQNRPDLDMSECGAVRAGKSCNVRCLNGGAISRTYAGCDLMYKWDLPTCNIDCSDPRSWLQAVFLVLVEDCRDKTTFPSGTSCKLACTNGGKFLSKPTVECRENGQWTELPLCSCPPLHVQQPYQTVKDCSETYNGQFCPLDLHPDFQFLTAEQNRQVRCDLGKWSALPPIRQRFCKLPVNMDPLVAVPPACNQLSFNGVCDLQCKGGGRFLNVGTTSFRVTCIMDNEMPDRLRWDFAPVCTCTMPIRSPPSLCSGITLDNVCIFKCNDRWETSVSIKCQSNGLFEIPRCPPV